VEEIIFEHNAQLFFFIYLLSAFVGVSITVYFFKMYRLFSSSHILGLMIGIALISFSDFFFSSTVISVSQNDSFNIFRWMQLSITSYGFVFLALVYYFQKSNEKKLSIIIKSIFLSLVPIICVLIFIPLSENIGIPSFQQYNEYFRIINMVSIGYILFRTFNTLELKTRKILFLIPLGFTILFLSQFTRFLFAIDPVTLTITLSGIMKIIALTIILFALTRDSKKTKDMELKDG